MEQVETLVNMANNKPPKLLVTVVFLQAVVTLCMMPSIETQIASVCGIIIIDVLTMLVGTLLNMNDACMQLTILMFSVLLWVGISLIM